MKEYKQWFNKKLSKKNKGSLFLGLGVVRIRQGALGKFDF
jgi:hypothetical protein